MGRSMSDREICLSYRLAKDKFVQIEILAELNLTDKEEIVKILLQNGEQPYLSNKKMVKEMKRHKTAYMEAFFKRIDELDAKIAKMEKEYMEIVELVKE